MKLSIGILASGNLGLDTIKIINENGQNINFICTDKQSIDLIIWAKSKNIPIFIGNPRNGAVSAFIKDKSIDLLLSINYLFLIEQDLIDLPSKIAVNFHGSLLPKYRGRTPHVWAIINNEKETGITAHLMDNYCDNGDIILQQKIVISEEDTGGTMLRKFGEIYPKMVMKLISLVESNSYTLLKQNQLHATYFGKRSAEHGEICWDWSKERIKNWVRAQAYPYPGAFTFLEGVKITIDKIKFDQLGFNQNDPNGLILNENPLIVKTPNGAVLIEKIRESIKVLKGQVLGK